MCSGVATRECNQITQTAYQEASICLFPHTVCHATTNMMPSTFILTSVRGVSAEYFHCLEVSQILDTEHDGIYFPKDACLRQTHEVFVDILLPTLCTKKSAFA